MKSILEINRRRKSFFTQHDLNRKEELAEELKVLNATADIQARALQRYQHQIEVSQRA